MTEAEEVAENLLPKYFAEVYIHSGVGLRRWVTEQLRATQSYNTIDAVAEAMDKIIFPPRTREDGKLAHVWLEGKYLGFSQNSKLYDKEMCRDCGVIRPHPAYPETPCKGNVRVTPR